MWDGCGTTVGRLWDRGGAKGGMAQREGLIGHGVSHVSLISDQVLVSYEMVHRPPSVARVAAPTAEKAAIPMNFLHLISQR